jgi:hypothetical protein
MQVLLPYPICCSFGRYSPLGEAQSHLLKCALRRYQNKANHTKRSAKQLHSTGIFAHYTANFVITNSIFYSM